jgi:hypothetical protein
MISPRNEAVGWINLAVIVGGLLAASTHLVRRAVQRWWDFLIIVVLTVALVPVLYKHVTGDISAWVRVGWSDGFDGKGEIILASAASTILLPLVLAAAALILIKRIAEYASADRQS